MKTLEQYLDSNLMSGCQYFTRADALANLHISSDAFTVAATRLNKKSKLISPWKGFYLILRPEDRHTGAPEPALWIDPLMKYLEQDYRISLLNAAAFHGSSHQAAMVFQVIVAKQLRSFNIGRHRIQFIVQKPDSFSFTNQDQWLDLMKTDTGYVKVAGIELLLLDSIRYFHSVGGINSVAQIVYDLGAKANTKQLKKLAAYYENSAVRRLGYLLEHCGYNKQSDALTPMAGEAKSSKLLDPSIKSFIPELAEDWSINAEWKLTINTPVEIDI